MEVPPPPATHSGIGGFWLFQLRGSDSGFEDLLEGKREEEGTSVFPPLRTYSRERGLPGRFGRPFLLVYY